jgi:hypothetical protein
VKGSRSRSRIGCKPAKCKTVGAICPRAAGCSLYSPPPPSLYLSLLTHYTPPLSPPPTPPPLPLFPSFHVGNLPSWADRESSSLQEVGCTFGTITAADLSRYGGTNQSESASGKRNSGLCKRSLQMLCRKQNKRSEHENTRAEHAKQTASGAFERQ